MRKYTGLKLLISFLCCFVVQISIAQKATINGIVTDETGETLIGAHVFVKSTNFVTVTNEFGFYSITIPLDTIQIQVSYVGYKLEESAPIILDKDIKLDITLQTEDLEMVEVVADRTLSIEEKVQMSDIQMTVERIKKIPSIAGEPDIIKAITLTPGADNGTEGSAGLFVRGGTPDQNLILLDGATVYNPNHLFGFLSVFNPDAIKSINFIKGGFPARYGGRLSSVLDINMKEGNTQKIKGSVGVGLLSSRMTLEGPLVKDKASFLVSGRSSYLGLFLLPLQIQYKAGKRDDYLGYFMYDFNAKVNYKLKNNNSLYFSCYTGKDRFTSKYQDYPYLETSNRLNWGNITATLRYNHTLSSNLFWKNMIVYSQFNYKLVLQSDKKNEEGLIEGINYQNKSRLQDVMLKSHLDYIPNPRHYLRFGIESTRHFFTPQISAYISEDNLFQDMRRESKVNANEVSLFAEDELKITSNLKANIGVRMNTFLLSDTSYLSIEPRLSLALTLPRNFGLKAAYTIMQQNIHLLANNGISFQNDIWVPSTKTIAPQQSMQWALGAYKSFPDKKIDISFEVYYKKMKNLIDYKEGTNLILNINNDWDEVIETGGVGRSYGLELFVNKKIGKFSGFLAYTLSNTDRQFDNINNGEAFPFKYDVRHNFSVTANYKLSKAWDISGTFVWKSGYPVTLPVASYAGADFTGQSLGGYVQVFDKRNGQRLPVYHRADVAFNYKKISKKGFTNKWSFGIYNLYYRKNVFYVQLVNESIVDTSNGEFLGYKQKLETFSLLPIIPSISYAIDF